MYTQSLLTYSINYPSNNKPALPSVPIVLPPLNSCYASSKVSRDVLHPPTTHPSPYLSNPLLKASALALSSAYFTSPKSTSSSISSESGSSSLYSHDQLTENNLVNSNYYSGIPSPPKSVSSVASVSPVSSPSLSKAYPVQFNLEHQHQHQTLASPSSTTHSDSAIQQAVSPQKKRRQRSGPSCDSCRQRKVKCNAEIHILSTDAEDFESHYSQYNLSELEISKLLSGARIQLGGSNQLIIQNNKLVRFRSCKSCENKSFPCCFSKGFTKEDIIFLSKKSDGKVSKPETTVATVAVAAAALPAITKTLDAKIVKKSPTKKSVKEDSPNRKSSCNLCRQRKVKCIFNEEIGKCEGCHRKNKSCSFDSV